MITDCKYIMQQTDGLENLNVRLKSTRKGVGIFTVEPIRKGEIIAFYKLRVRNVDTYKSPTNDVYTCCLYYRNGKEINHLVADVYKGSVRQPLNDVPYWAQFANEPSKGESVNAEIDVNYKYNYRNRLKLTPGCIVVYDLRALRYIYPGEEVLWYYGKDYNRDYDLGNID